MGWAPSSANERDLMAPGPEFPPWRGPAYNARDLDLPRRMRRNADPWAGHGPEFPPWYTAAPSALGTRAIPPIGSGVFPGQLLEVHVARFEYRGPRRFLAVGWGLKPYAGFGGINFDNGGGLVDGYFGVSLPFSVNQSDGFVPYHQNLSQASFPAPAPGSYVTRGGKSVKFNQGSVDSWVWIIDWTKMQDAYSGIEDLVRESYFLPLADSGSGITTDAGVFKLGGENTAAQKLEVAYRVL